MTPDFSRRLTSWSTTSHALFRCRNKRGHKKTRLPENAEDIVLSLTDTAIDRAQRPLSNMLSPVLKHLKLPLKQDSKQRISNALPVF